MPAVETWLLVQPAAQEKILDGSPDGFSKRPAKNGNFDSVMQATLMPRNSNPIKSNSSLPDKSRSVGKSAQADRPAALVAGEKLQEKTSTEKISSEKKGPDGGAGQNSPDFNTPTVLNGAEPTPAFLSLPSLLSGAPSGPTDILRTTTPKADQLNTLGSAPTIAGQTNQTSLVSSIISTSDMPAPAILQKNGEAAFPIEVTTVQNLSNPSFTVKTDSPSMSPEAEATAEKLTAASQETPASEPSSSAKGRTGSAMVKTSDLTVSGQETIAVADSTAASPTQPAPDLLAESAAPVVLNIASENLADRVASFDASRSSGKVAQDTGTGVANMGSLMKNPQKTNKVAGLNVKVLPVGENIRQGEHNLPLQLPATPMRATENRVTDLNLAFANSGSQSSVAGHAPALNVVDSSSLVDARLRTLERTHDMMVLHTMRLLESKSDMLSVIIKPAVGTELSLELRLDQGGVKAQATLTRGDHQFLNQHWPELQQRLEQRGIKLAPLGGEMDFSANSNSQFQQKQTSQEDTAQQASAFAEFAAAGPVGGASARLAAVHDGWESWA